MQAYINKLMHKHIYTHSIFLSLYLSVMDKHKRRYNTQFFLYLSHTHINLNTYTNMLYFSYTHFLSLYIHLSYIHTHIHTHIDTRAHSFKGFQSFTGPLGHQ